MWHNAIRCGSESQGCRRQHFLRAYVQLLALLKTSWASNRGPVLKFFFQDHAARARCCLGLARVLAQQWLVTHSLLSPTRIRDHPLVHILSTVLIFSTRSKLNFYVKHLGLVKLFWVQIIYLKALSLDYYFLLPIFVTHATTSQTSFPLGDWLPSLDRYQDDWSK